MEVAPSFYTLPLNTRFSHFSEIFHGKWKTFLSQFVGLVEIFPTSQDEISTMEIKQTMAEKAKKKMYL